jgi:hypothetical protein
VFASVLVKMASSLILSTLMLVSSVIASPPGYGSHHSSPNTNTKSCAVSHAPAPTVTDLATCSAPRSIAYSAWSYTVETSTRYATPLPSPLALTTSFAPHFSEASSLLPANATYTSYSLNRNATALQDGKYGQGAYARLWATVSFNNSVPFTTTVSPTPVASSELIYPPALYTACPNSADTCLDCYRLPEDFVWGVASSAFQIEGGLTEDGRGPGAFDTIGAVGYVGRAPDEADWPTTSTNKTLLVLRPLESLTSASRCLGPASCLSALWAVLSTRPDWTITRM